MQKQKSYAIINKLSGRQQNIRVWRSLVSRLNGVQEALSSNLNTRTTSEQALYGLLRFFIKVGIRSCRCASVSNQNRFVGLGLRLGVRPEITASILPRCYKQGARAGTRIPALVLFAMTQYNKTINDSTNPNLERRYLYEPKS